jgi:hypothetical protein
MASEYASGCNLISLSSIGMSSDSVTFSNRGVFYRQYNGESDLQYIMSLVQNELSEPYVIYTYRYFLQGW